MNLFNLWILLQVWCHLAPLAVAEAPEPVPSAPPDPDPSPPPDPDLFPSPDPNPSPSPNPALVPELVPVPELIPTDLFLPAVPLAMAWIGSIGGLLGVISFADTYIHKLVGLFKGPEPGPSPPPAKHDTPWFREFERYWRQHLWPHWTERIFPKKNGEPSWKVGVQVGLDGTGLEGAGGEFPQICLWNMHGELVGYNDQTIHIAESKFDKSKEFNEGGTREDIPQLLSGGFKVLGIWPAPGLEDRKDQQAIYVTMIKRHFDAICVSSVWVESHGKDKWLLDGSWGRASNMSWYYSYVIESNRQGECFWLDHRGDLKHKKDLEDDYIQNNVKEINYRKKTYSKWFFASEVTPETGIPEGDDLTDGMRENGVHEYKVPLGVKFHAPQFTASNYAEDLNGLTISDFVDNPARINWITEPTRMRVRRGNPLLPILHPRASLSEKHPAVMWEDPHKQDIPVDCMTDWYYDENDNLIEPGDHDRCVLMHIEPFQDQIQRCRDKNFIDKNVPQKRSIDDGPVASQPPPPLHERHARTLVNDKNRRYGGSLTKELCENPHSVGPNYANHKEHWFCRMTDKTLWPFCNSKAGVLHDCFDAEAEILVEKNKPLGKRAHHWDIIEDWHSGQKFKRAA